MDEVKNNPTCKVCHQQTIKPDSFSTHRELILYRLNKLDQNHNDLDSKLDTLCCGVNEIRQDLATQKIKAGFWGSLSGLVAAITVSIFAWLGTK